jgi:hypothetical protein
MIVLLLCAAFIVALYLAAGVMLLFSIWHWHRTSTWRMHRNGIAPLSPVFIWARRVIFSLALLGVAVAAEFFVEPYWLEVTHVRIASPKLLKGGRTVRIAQISDLHCDRKPRLEERLPEIIASQRPDVIVFTGDAINVPDGLPIFKRCMTRLAEIAPTFAVRGNWDVNTSYLFDGTGVHPLDREAVTLCIGGEEIWIGGVAIGRPLPSGLCFQNAPPNALRIFLYHFPTVGVTEAAKAKVDLCLAGHTHGGQVVIPFCGSIPRLAGYDEKYRAGLYQVEDTWLYVNRGIGMEGGPWPRVRFLARPEVTILDIVPQD